MFSNSPNPTISFTVTLEESCASCESSLRKLGSRTLLHSPTRLHWFCCCALTEVTQKVTRSGVSTRPAVWNPRLSKILISQPHVDGDMASSLSGRAFSEHALRVSPLSARRWFIYFTLVRCLSRTHSQT